MPFFRRRHDGSAPQAHPPLLRDPLGLAGKPWAGWFPSERGYRMARVRGGNFQTQVDGRSQVIVNKKVCVCVFYMLIIKEMMHCIC